MRSAFAASKVVIPGKSRQRSQILAIAQQIIAAVDHQAGLAEHEFQKIGYLTSSPLAKDTRPRNKLERQLSAEDIMLQHETIALFKCDKRISTSE
jgi:hypothetical protein